jgi:hypothetical protein
MQADWQASQSLAQQFVQAFHAGNTEQAGQLLDQISAAPDHRSQVSAYLNQIGLAECVTLEAK